MIKKILLDMDGTICDFCNAALKLWGTDLNRAKEHWRPRDYKLERALDVSQKEFYDKIEKEGERFWTNLKPYTWANELYSLCCSIAPTCICTDVGQFSGAFTGKIKWIKKNLENLDHDDYFKHYMVTPRKEFAASPTTLLIDDDLKKVSSFRLGGGQAILFPRYWNPNYKLENKAYEYTERILNRITKN